MTGLFTYRTPHNQNLRRYQQHKKRERSRQRLELFAEALAEGATISAAARHAGVCQQRGSAMLAEIRRGLGAQAI